MKPNKTVLYTALLSVFAGAVTAAGVLLCISLSHSTGAEVDGWDLYLMLPKTVSSVIAVTLLILDCLCVFMAAALAVSYVKSSKAITDADKKSGAARFSRLMDIDKNGADAKSARLITTALICLNSAAASARSRRLIWGFITAKASYARLSRGFPARI